MTSGRGNEAVTFASAPARITNSVAVNNSAMMLHTVTSKFGGLESIPGRLVHVRVVEAGEECRSLPTRSQQTRANLVRNGTWLCSEPAGNPSHFALWRGLNSTCHAATPSLASVRVTWRH
jgi:hypothetical protein